MELTGIILSGGKSSRMGKEKGTSLLMGKPLIEYAVDTLSQICENILIGANTSDYDYLGYPVGKLVLISIVLGFLPSIIIMVADFSEENFPGSDFTLLEKIIYIWLWASICEEVFTRGLIQGFLLPAKHIGFNFMNRFISLPVMIGAAFFGFMHFMLLTLGLAFFAVLTIVIFGIVLGIIAGYYREQTNSLVPAIMVHMCFNIGGSLLGLFA